MPSSTNATKLTELTEEIKSLVNTIRGSNGYPGVVAELTVLKSRFNDICEAVKETNTAINALLPELQQIRADLKEMQKAVTIINQRGCDYGQAAEKHHIDGGEKSENEIEKQVSKQAVTHEWIRDKFSVPIIVSLLLMLIYALPKIIELLK